MRLLLFSGGGGAGVTTLAASAAVRCAEQGARTRLLAADAGALDGVLPPGAPPSRLSMAPLDPQRLLGADAAAVTGWLRALLRWSGVDESLADDVASLPGADALAALLAADDGAADVTVVDLGPLARALPLLCLLCTDPGDAGSDEPRGGLARLAGGLVATLAAFPRPDDAVRAAGARAAGRLAALRQTLRSPTRCSLRLVLPDDARAPRLLREALTACGLHGIGLDAVVTRGAAPPDCTPAPIVVPWQPAAPVGVSALSHIAELTYATAAPQALLSRPRLPTFVTDATGVELVLPLPSRPPQEFRVRRRQARIEVTAGRWRRALPLPHCFASWHGRRAWHDGTALRVRLEA